MKVYIFVFILSVIVLLSSIICLAMEIKMSDAPPEVVAYWKQPVHWYGVGLLILSICGFISALILKTDKAFKSDGKTAEEYHNKYQKSINRNKKTYIFVFILSMIVLLVSIICLAMEAQKTHTLEYINSWHPIVWCGVGLLILSICGFISALILKKN